MSLTDYRRRKVDLELWRRRHLRNAPPGCGCVLCNPEREIAGELLARVKAAAERNGEPPF